MRGLVFAVVSGLASAGWLYQRWTNPSAVRAQVIAKLSADFSGAHVSLEAARLRLLGGISFSELRLTRRDDPEKTELAYIPSGVIYHDKERLLDGKMAIRKIELDRPRLRVIREPDGRWNLAGILGIQHAEEPIPTMVIKHGTILLEDRAAGSPGRPTVLSVEIKDVSFTLINDPLRTLNFELKGRGEFAGGIRVLGAWQRDSGAIALTLQAPAVVVGPTLAQWLTLLCPELAEHAQHLRGTADLTGEMDYRPAKVDPAPREARLHYDFHCELTRGTLNHPQVPLPLDRLEASVRCVDGQLTLKQLTARSGPARVELKAGVWSRSPAMPKEGDQAVESRAVAASSASRCFSSADLEGDLSIEQLTVNSELFLRLPEAWQSARKLNTDFKPVGSVNLSVQFSRSAGCWRRHCVLHPVDVTASLVNKFDYQLEHITGVIEDKFDEASHTQELHVDLAGKAGDRPVYIRGDVHGEAPTSEVQIDVWGNDIVIDEKVLRALPEKQQALARSFRPAGLGDFMAQIRREAGSEKYANRYTIRVHDATACYDVFPYPLEEISGLLDIQPGHWEFRDFCGRHKGGQFRTHGRSYPTPAGDRAAIEISGENILLDAELEAALTPAGAAEPSALQTAWKAFAPAGRMSFTAKVDELPNRPQDISVTVTARNCAIRPTFFPYQLSDVSTTVSYKAGEVDVLEFAGKHGATVLRLESSRDGKEPAVHVDLIPGGGFYAKLPSLRGTPILPDGELLSALPEGLRKICTALELRDALRLDTELVIKMDPGSNKPDVYWNGGLALHDAAVRAGVLLEHVTGQAWCRGRHNGERLLGVRGNVILEQATLYNQPFRNIHTQIEVPEREPDLLQLPSLKAQLYGGNVGGVARVEFGPMIHYEVDLTALGVKLEEFGRQNRLGPNAQLSGQATARLYLRGHGSDLADLEGQGSIDVPNGKIKELPVLLDLLKVLNFRPPDRTLFEEAHANFGIRGQRVTVNRLDLYGNVISLSGQGEMNIDGSDLQLDFYAVWARIVQVLPPILRDIPSTIGQWVLKVKLRGRIGDMRFTKEPVPGLVEPVEQFLKRMKGQQKPDGTKAAVNQPMTIGQ